MMQRTMDKPESSTAEGVMPEEGEWEAAPVAPASWARQRYLQMFGEQRHQIVLKAKMTLNAVECSVFLLAPRESEW